MMHGGLSTVRDGSTTAFQGLSPRTADYAPRKHPLQATDTIALTSRLENLPTVSEL